MSGVKGEGTDSHETQIPANLDREFSGGVVRAKRTLLSLVLEYLGVDAPAPVAATGKINFSTNTIEPFRTSSRTSRVAADTNMKHLVLPVGEHKFDGMHGDVRYWVARDTNEQVVAVDARGFRDRDTAAWSDVRLPRRRTAGYRWIHSLRNWRLSAGGRLDAGGDPPVSLERVLLGAARCVLCRQFCVHPSILAIGSLNASGCQDVNPEPCLPLTENTVDGLACCVILWFLELIGHDFDSRGVHDSLSSGNGQRTEMILQLVSALPAGSPHAQPTRRSC